MIRLIENPTSGNGFAARTEPKLKTILQTAGKAFEIKHTSAPGEAKALAREAAEQGAEAVIAVGGDGTVSECAAGLFGSRVPLGIIPTGTGNDFIKTVGTPKDPEEALRFILNHPARPVDVGRINDDIFINVCGTGFDVTVLDEAAKVKHISRGLLPYLIGLIRAVAHNEPVHLELTIDGKEQVRDLLICSIANGRYIGGGIPICPEADPADGKLNCMLVSGVSKGKILRLLPGLMKGKISSFDVTEPVLCERIRMVKKGMRVNIDGEIRTMDSADFSIVPGGLMLYW